MTILPFGPTLPVHCCCDPSLRLGWVPCRLTEPGPVVFIAGHVTRDLWIGAVSSVPERVHTEVASLWDNGERVLAVKSNEHPIETWRKIPGFIEERR